MLCVAALAMKYKCVYKSAFEHLTHMHLGGFALQS